MRTFTRPLIASIFFAATSSAFAHVAVSNAWVRATVPQQQATGVFMDLRSGHDNAKLVGVKTDAAATAEVHEMRMQDNVMQMRALPSLDLPNGQTVNLKPGSYHIMLMGLKNPVKAGDSVKLTLEVVHEDGAKESIAVDAPVRALGTTTNNSTHPAGADGHMHHAPEAHQH